MLIKACLNGSRAPGEHEALPLSPDELARAAEQSVSAGACALHIHPRAPDGAQSLAPAVQTAALSAIRARCPGIPVGVSTAIWIEPRVERRLALVQAWTQLPDFASVNLAEPGALEFCALLLARGIGVEAGLASVEDAELLAGSDIASRCLRVLIEPAEETPGPALRTAERIAERLDERGIQTPRLLHGVEEAAWPVLEATLRRGYDARIGLEDTLSLPDGRRARDNAELVAYARELAERLGQS